MFHTGHGPKLQVSIPTLEETQLFLLSMAPTSCLLIDQNVLCGVIHRMGLEGPAGILNWTVWVNRQH